MQLAVAYRGRSILSTWSGGVALTLAPNLRRDKVSFVGTLQQPLRFREAISALHDVVISDLRYQPKDRTAYRQFLAEQQKREAEIRRGAREVARQDIVAKEPEPIPAGFETTFSRLRGQYWDARQKYANYLSRHDPELWRLLMPCDPVITVAPDVLFFECFSADESSYGCLTVDRSAFTAEEAVALGTTNVDYSWNLFVEFQKLRSYRQTKFSIDPSGFEVKTEAMPDFREEKIDLPQSWLRGFMQLQSAMSLPMRKVPVSREGLYNVLAWLKRHKAARSPRAVRFELVPGQPVAIVLEPWDRKIVLHSTPYPGPRPETIRVWGRDRLRVLARLLPLVESVDVYLLGNGFPSFWSLKLGDMRFLLGLSGWTANDWTGGSALDQLMPPAEPSNELIGDIGGVFKNGTAFTFEQIRQRTGAAPHFVAVGLNRLAMMGQVIHDLAAGLYRWRQIMPVPVALAQITSDSPETDAAKILIADKACKLVRDERSTSGLRIMAGEFRGMSKPVEAVLDLDGRIIRGKCTCSHHFQFGLKRGPCRHLQTVRAATKEDRREATLEGWFKQLWN